MFGETKAQTMSDVYETPVSSVWEPRFSYSFSAQCTVHMSPGGPSKRVAHMFEDFSFQKERNWKFYVWHNKIKRGLSILVILLTEWCEINFKIK